MHSLRIQCHERDRHVLLNFKHTVDDLSSILSSWSDDGRDCCEWVGIQCDNNTGEIPRSLAQLSFLGTLNLSFNNFSRTIPLGTQLQGFDELSYIGNPELCGAPLPKNCSDKKEAKPIEKMTPTKKMNSYLPSTLH
ncbi:receptor-like protein EIX1 [Prosopis cineraria]|uniref:receptor-like protein EIX1 n=1 Tax=Prosopis cineraria TaxID=364024 RepID=UPI0024104334|nr:receptor-like protein EIX1 [Prosopis cineraria]